MCITFNLYRDLVAPLQLVPQAVPNLLHQPYTRDSLKKILLRTTWTLGAAPLKTHSFLCRLIIHGPKEINEFTPLFQCPGIKVFIRSLPNLSRRHSLSKFVELSPALEHIKDTDLDVGSPLRGQVYQQSNTYYELLAIGKFDIS